MAETPATSTAKKIRFFAKALSLTLITDGNIGKTPETIEQQNDEENNDLEEDSEQDSQLDLYMANLENGNELFLER